MATAELPNGEEQERHEAINEYLGSPESVQARARLWTYEVAFHRGNTAMLRERGLCRDRGGVISFYAFCGQKT